MSKFIRMTSLAAAAAVALGAAPAAAQAINPTGPANGKNATATARIIKPLTLTWKQDLNLGTILLSGAGAWTGAVIKVGQDGVRTCTDTTKVTCSGATAAAMYNVTGTNKQIVTINVADTLELTNQNDTTQKLTMAVDAPDTVTMPNAGNTGVDFSIGGTITVDSTTLDGVYQGTFDVTADYS